MSKIAVNRAAALEKKLVKAYSKVELVQSIECYFDDSAKSIVVHVDFAGGRELNEYMGDGTRAWELYRDAQKAIDADIDKQIAAELSTYQPISEEELQQIVDDTVESADAPFKEEGSFVSGLKKLLDDMLAPLCPRCGINTLDVERPALNARSRVAPIAICSPCGTHEALSSAGLDLWHDKAALAAALDEQRASRAAADTALQQSVERARQARAERLARETLCEAAVTPAQKSAIAAAVVWPA